MKNIIRKTFSILFLLIAFYFLTTGITSFLGTISMLVSLKEQVSFWRFIRGTQWFNIVADPILIIGLILMLIGTYLWSWRRWRIVVGIEILITGIYAGIAALLVSLAPAASTKDIHLPTFIIGYIFFAVLSIVLGVVFIRGQKRLSQSNPTA